MTNLEITTLVPQTSDNERMLLARLLAAQGASPNRGTLLASAARTATTSTSSQNWAGRKAVILFWNVTGAGTSNLYVSWDYLDPISGNWLSAATISTSITTVALRCYVIGPATIATSGWNLSGGGIQFPLSSQSRVRVVHGDASAWTYSLGYELI
jgi:hypothetical protein